MSTATKADPIEESIGGRIKALRRARDMTLAEVAEKAGLSSSHLSQIERDKVMPSLMALAGIAGALKVSMRELFDNDEEHIYIRRAQAVAQSDNGASPVTSMRLTRADSLHELEVHKLVLEPGASPLAFASFAGEVLGFVLEGALELVTEDGQYVLEAGDSIHFDAHQPYSLQCSGGRACALLWCTSPPSGALFEPLPKAGT